MIVMRDNKQEKTGVEKTNEKKINAYIEQISYQLLQSIDIPLIYCGGISHLRHYTRAPQLKTWLELYNDDPLMTCLYSQFYISYFL